MIVVAIIGILAAVAIPAYQDYTIRAKVSEGVNLAAAAKSAVSEYYISTNNWPSSNPTAGLTTDVRSTYVTSMSISGNGLITVTYRDNTGVSSGQDTIFFRPSFSDGTVQWACTGGTVLGKYRPANCRP
jgi:type IV pilus assembly protein PilA